MPLPGMEDAVSLIFGKFIKNFLISGIYHSTREWMGDSKQKTMEEYYELCPKTLFYRPEGQNFPRYFEKR